MNFSKAQIAALVLGYLKNEKLQSVVDEFTKCCSYFGENNENIRMGKYFVTRVAGLTLVDILEQYSVIYAIVQGRLEETNYYEMYSRTTLVEQLLYLLEKENIATSTPVNCSSEVDATPAHSLPGNSLSQDDGNSLPKTPKKRNTRSKSKEKDEMMEMTEVLTQSLLENHELHEKIAETINIVRNTSEVSKTVLDECISAGACKEIDAVIKTVIQRTEEDPLYNKLIDEIIGTTPNENPPSKKLTFSSTPSTTIVNFSEPQTKPLEESKNLKTADPIDDHNNDAIRSIIEAAQNHETPPPPNVAPPPAPPITAPPPTKTDTGEVYVFDGSLDTYLKTAGATNTINPNPVYINPGLIVMPPPETRGKQFYIVNNQPVINMPTVLTENEFMSIPTIIVNDEPPCLPKPKRNKLIKPKGTENTTKATEVAPIVTEVPRMASHVRNLDFSTPNGKSETKTKKAREWDSDLRQLIIGCKDKSPSPKRKRTVTKKRKTKKDEKEETKPEEKGLLTPVKDIIPKTPGGSSDSFHCTPFNDVIDEQLRGVDLSSIPTPSLPITPGFALTPGDVLGTNHRSTDYSTSSSYYQPSEPEPPKSNEELLEELRELDNTSPPPKSLKIISNTVITPATNETKKPYTEHVKKFNNKVIGKKNLNLIKQSSSSSSSSSDSDSEEEKDETNNTVVCRAVKACSAASIKDIITNMEVKKTLEDEKKKTILTKLEVVRRRTVDKLKNDGVRRKQPARNNKNPKKPAAKPRTKKTVKKKESSPENEDEAQKLVKGLAQRGIHLIPNKTPQKQNVKVEELSQKDNSDEDVVFERKQCDFEVVFEGKTKRKNIKSYDFGVLSKTMSATVSDENNQEVTTIIKWTNCECLYDSRDDEEDLMDFSLTAGVRGESPKTEGKGGKKRKSRFCEDENNKEKKNKTFVNYNNLLEKLDVDDFLDKLHGE